MHGALRPTSDVVSTLVGRARRATCQPPSWRHRGPLAPPTMVGMGEVVAPSCTSGSCEACAALQQTPVWARAVRYEAVELAPRRPRSTQEPSPAYGAEAWALGPEEACLSRGRCPVAGVALPPASAARSSAPASPATGGCHGDEPSSPAWNVEVGVGVALDQRGRVCWLDEAAQTGSAVPADVAPRRRPGPPRPEGSLILAPQPTTACRASRSARQGVVSARRGGADSSIAHLDPDGVQADAARSGHAGRAGQRGGWTESLTSTRPPQHRRTGRRGGVLDEHLELLRTHRAEPGEEVQVARPTW